MDTDLHVQLEANSLQLKHRRTAEEVGDNDDTMLFQGIPSYDDESRPLSYYNFEGVILVMYTALSDLHRIEDHRDTPGSP